MPTSVVATTGELEDGEMKHVRVGFTNVLLARIDGTFYATGAECSHYGGLLSKGALSGECVVCPLHHARFHLPTGEQLDPPGLGGLPTYDVEVKGGEVVVRVPDEGDDEDSPGGPPARQASEDAETLVVLGAGAAGTHAAEAARRRGFEGRLVMITREEDLPYDRPNLSKGYLQDEVLDGWMSLRPADFYEGRGIEIWTGREVAQADVEARRLTFAGGDTLGYDTLILCTGSAARTLAVPGADLTGICTLRSYADGRAIREAAEAAGQAGRVVVVGAGLIGMEVAASLRGTYGAEVTVVAPERVPFGEAFGEEVGRLIQAIHEEEGVRFRLDRKVRAFEGEGGTVRQVELESGETLDADLVVVGVGARPATGFLKGVRRAPDGGIFVDEHMRAAGGLYAAGDVAHFPDPRTGRRVRIEHWRTACQQGRVAGSNAAGDGERVAYRGVPFFWTSYFGNTFRSVGRCEEWDEVLIDGTLEERSFIAYYVKEGQVGAALGLRRTQEMAALEELMRRRMLPSPETLRRKDLDLTRRLREQQKKAALEAKNEPEARVQRPEVSP